MPRDTLRLRFALFFAAFALGGTALLCAGLWVGYARSGGEIDGYVIAGLIGALGLFGLGTWIGLLFDENVAKPILALSSDLHARASAGVSGEIDSEPARYLGTLAPAAQAIHEALEDARESQARAIAEKTARMARDKALLEALVRDLAEGIVVISPEGKILLFNQRAVGILGEIGLDRPLDRFLRLEPILDATDRLSRSGTTHPESFLAATTDGARILTGAASPVESEGAQIGHVLIFRDATEDLRTHGSLDALLGEMMDRARRPAMALSAILDVFETGDTLPPEQVARFTGAMREELRGLSDEVNSVAARRERIAAHHWPVRPTSVKDIFESLAARHETLTVNGSEILVDCDGFAVVTLLDRVLASLADGERSNIALGAEVQKNEVQLRLSWTGPAFPQAALEALAEAPLSDDYGSYTARDALDAHRTDIWIAAGPRMILPLPLSSPGPALGLPLRPDFYDFSGTRLGGENPRLEDLSFVVFDTETTGLDPERDEVVQIAGVRVLRGRIVEGETFDRLVNPCRPIPVSSTEIHGIDDGMVAKAETFGPVGAAFAEFCEEAVLVAHNAPFDMAFLKRLEAAGGARFDHPVLCTARLSATLDGHRSDHTLDGLVEAYGITLEDAHRHTALGDARATAEVFLKMLSVLAARDVRALNDALRVQSGKWY
ncbi:MAG: exonuclease domain-containing protein [Pseudomonadota bacterium]